MGSSVGTNQVKTSFGRLVAGLIIGEVGLLMALITPSALLITFKLMAIDPENAIHSLGMVAGIGALFALISNPIGGFISDRTHMKFGKRRTWILLGGILGGASLIGIALSTEVWMVGVSWCLVCIFFNFSLASYTALIADQVEESRRGSLSGILGMVSVFGALLGLILITMIGKASTLEKFGLLAAVGVITSLISCILIKDNKAEYRHSESKVSFVEALSKIYPSPRKFPVFTWGLITRFCVTVAYCSSAYNAMMFMQRYHYTQEKATGIVTLISMICVGFIAFSSVLGGILSDKLKRQKPFVAFSPLVVAIGLLINAFAPSIPFVILGFALAGFGYGIYTGVDLALITRILPRKEDTAKDMGLMNIANTLPQSVVPLIAPLLLQIGSWPFYFCFLAIFGLLSSLAVIPIPEISAKPIEEVKI